MMQINPANGRVVDRDYVLAEFDHSAKRMAKKLIEKFDIVYSTRDQVQHFPLDNAVDSDPAEICKMLETMDKALWLALISQIQTELVAAYGDSLTMFNRLIGEAKLGKLKICPPNRFDYVNTAIDELKTFAWTRFEESDQRTYIRAEINFAVELY
jgi:hypothetical protein